MRILGGKRAGVPGAIKSAATWKMEQLDNAFRFYLSEFQDKELLIEYDELIAAGPAYNRQEPLNILDVLKRLEELVPNFYGVQISEDILLIRKRLELSRGLSLLNGSKQLFMKDDTLKTINFLDFYREYISES